MLATKKRKQNDQSTKSKKRKIRGLSNLDVSEFLVTNNIRNKNEKRCIGKGPCKFPFESSLFKC